MKIKSTHEVNDTTNSAVRRRGIRELLPIVAALFPGVVYVWVGSKEAFTSLSFPFRILGGIILICGLLGIAVAVAIRQLQRLAWQDTKFRYVDTVRASAAMWFNVIIVGSITSATLSIILSVVQATAGEPTRWLVVWPVLAIASCYVLILAVRAGMAFPDLRKVIGGLSITVLVSVVGLGYTDFYLPSAKSPFLIVTLKVQKASIDSQAKLADIPISVTIRNSQDVGVYLLGAYYDVAGRRQSSSSSQSWGAREEQEASSSLPIRQSGVDSSYDLLEENSAGNETPGSFLNTGESISVREVAEIPLDTAMSYGAIQVSCSIMFMRNDRVQLDPSFPGQPVMSWNPKKLAAPSWVLNGMSPGTSFMNWTAPVTDDNYLTQRLHQQKMVSVWYLLPPPNSATPYFPKLVGIITSPADVSKGLSSPDILSELNRYSLGLAEASYDTETTAELGIKPKK